MAIKKMVLLSCIVLGAYQSTSPMEFLQMLGGQGMAGMGGQKPQFPIKEDDTLGPDYSHQALAAACCQGDKDILEHFVENYPDLLELSYEDSYPLALATFAYIRGEPVCDITPSIDGLRVLIEAESLKKNFRINVGFKVMDFDEYIIQEAHYPEDAGKQQRLIEVQKLLGENLSEQRLKELDAALALKKKDKLRRAKNQVVKTNSRNKVLAFVGGLVGVAGLYWLYASKVKSSTPQKGAATAVA
jgi:hypothetical protein